jgi:hypothetical protein
VKAVNHKEYESALVCLSLPQSYTLIIYESSIVLKGPYDHELDQIVRQSNGYWDGETHQDRKLWILRLAYADSLLEPLKYWARNYRNEGLKDRGESLADQNKLRELMDACAVSELKGRYGLIGVETRAKDYIIKIRNERIKASPSCKEFMDRLKRELGATRCRVGEWKVERRLMEPLMSMLVSAKENNDKWCQEIVASNARKRPQKRKPKQPSPSDAEAFRVKKIADNERERLFDEANAVRIKWDKKIGELGTRPEGPNSVEGEKLFDTETLYGGGHYFVVTEHKIWSVQ